MRVCVNVSAVHSEVRERERERYVKQFSLSLSLSPAPLSRQHGSGIHALPQASNEVPHTPGRY